MTVRPQFSKRRRAGSRTSEFCGMIAVSNTTPLRYLIAIQQEGLLGQIFEKVFVPTAVHEEPPDVRTAENVRKPASAILRRLV